MSKIYFLLIVMISINSAPVYSGAFFDEISASVCKVESEVYERNSLGVVTKSKLIGSGTVIHEDEEYYRILTNSHVIGDSANSYIKFYKNGGISPPIEAKREWSMYRKQSTADYAILRIQKSLFKGDFKPKPIKLLNKDDKIETGSLVFGAANPYGAWLNYWEGKVIYSGDDILKLNFPSLVGQSGSAVMAKIDGETTIVGVITWNDSQNNAGVAISSANFINAYKYNILPTTSMDIRRYLETSDHEEVCRKCGRRRGSHFYVYGPLDNGSQLYCPTPELYNNFPQSEYNYKPYSNLDIGNPWRPGQESGSPVIPERELVKDPILEKYESEIKENEKLRKRLEELNKNLASSESQKIELIENINSKEEKLDELRSANKSLKSLIDEESRKKEGEETLPSNNSNTDPFFTIKENDPVIIDGKDEGINQTALAIGGISALSILLTGIGIYSKLSKKIDTVKNVVDIFDGKDGRKEINEEVVINNNNNWSISDINGLRFFKDGDKSSDVTDQPYIEQAKIIERNGNPIGNKALKGRFYREAVSLMKQDNLPHYNSGKLYGQIQAAEAIEDYVERKLFNGENKPLLEEYLKQQDKTVVAKDAFLCVLYEDAIPKLKRSEPPFDKLTSPVDIANSIEKYVRQNFLREKGIFNE